MLKRWLCQADITLDLTCRDPILIKSGYSTLDGPDMVPVVTARSGKPEYFLPGSSLKGVFRSHSERIIRTLPGGMVCVPYIQKKKDERQDEGLHLSCGQRFRNLSSPQRYRYSCPACRAFGSLQFAGRVSISDAYAPEGVPSPIVEQRDGVAIDRRTGGAAGVAKFELMVITSGTFRATVSLRNFELWQLGMIHLVIQDLADGLVRVGSGKSRGLGRVSAAITDYLVSYPRAVSSLMGLAELATDAECDQYGLYGPAQLGLPFGEPARVAGIRHVYNLTELWPEAVADLVGRFTGFLESGYPNGHWLSTAQSVPGAGA